MAMSQEHKTLLTRNRLRLVREVFLNQEMYAVLQSNYTLTPTMIEEIESVKTTQGKVGKLLDILPKRGGVAFPTFIDALIETHQESLAALLDPSHTSSSPSSSGTVISQPRDSGPGGHQLAPSNTSSSTDQTKGKLGDVSSGKQPQQPSDALSGKPPSSKGPVHPQQPSSENASSKTASGNIKGISDVDLITHCVYQSQNHSFIYDLYPSDDGEEPDKKLFQESLSNGRCVVFRNNLSKKHGYEPKFDDVNLIEAFKKFGIKVEGTFKYKSPEDIHGRLCTETKTDTSAFFFFVFAYGSGDVIVTDDGKCVSTSEIVDIVKNSDALKGKPKVVIFHLTDSGPVDNMDSVAESPYAAPSQELSGLSLNAADDNLAILKVAPPASDDLKIHWLVSSLIFLMTKFSKKHDLNAILHHVKLVLERQAYSVTLSSSLKNGLYFTS